MLSGVVSPDLSLLAPRMLGALVFGTGEHVAGGLAAALVPALLLYVVFLSFFRVSPKVADVDPGQEGRSSVIQDRPANLPFFVSNAHPCEAGL